MDGNVRNCRKPKSIGQTLFCQSNADLRVVNFVRRLKGLDLDDVIRFRWRTRQ
jgi:hypothetical protein